MADEKTVPPGTEWTMTIPTDRKEGKATFYLKDMDIDLYIAVQSYIEAGKEREAMLAALGGMCIGGDNYMIIKDNYIAYRAAQQQLFKIIAPLPGELKKN